MEKETCKKCGTEIDTIQTLKEELKDHKKWGDHFTGGIFVGVLLMSVLITFFGIVLYHIIVNRPC